MVFTWIDHLLFIIIALVLPIMAIATSTQMDEESEDLGSKLKFNKKDLYYQNGLMLWIGALVVSTAWLYAGKSYHALGLSTPVINNKVLMLCGALILIYVVDLVISIAHYKRESHGSDDDSLDFIAPTNFKEFKHFVFLALSAGVCEEVIFRGFLVNYVKYWVPDHAWQLHMAVLVSSVFFSISHLYQGWINVLKIFVIALLFGYIYVYSQSLVLVVIIHFLVDLVSGMMMLVFNKKNEN